MYEYKSVRTEGTNPSPEEQVVEMAAKFAKEGWELVAVVATQFQSFGQTAFFKRKKA